MRNKKEEDQPIPSIPTPPPFIPPIPFIERWDRFWPRFREFIAFVGGFGIMAFEALGDTSDRPWLYAAAIGMMGLPVARYAENTLSKWGSNRVGPTDAPPDPSPKSKRTS